MDKLAWLLDWSINWDTIPLITTKSKEMKVFTQKQVEELVYQIDEAYRPHTRQNILGDEVFFEYQKDSKTIVDLEDIKETIRMLINLTLAQGANDEWIEIIEAKKTLNKLTEL